MGIRQKSDSTAISERLARLANVDADRIIGCSGRRALAILVEALGQLPSDAAADHLFKQLKQAIGWKGRPSKGSLALEKIRDAERVTLELWQRTTGKLNEESNDQSSKPSERGNFAGWMASWRAHMESRLGLPFRMDKDYIWEHGVALDHALRRVSAAHTWIKRAEVERRRFQEDARKLNDPELIPIQAREWLDAFRASRSSASGALGDYLIRKRAIDGWSKVAHAWAALGPHSTRKQRIDAARDVQANLDDNEKFGDIQIFGGFGDEHEDDPQSCLADDEARCVWQRNEGQPAPEILKNYVDATVAEHDQRRFKVPAFRHPDPLRHPVYVDFGNSRWDIAYSVLKAVGDRQGTIQKLAEAKTDKTREKLRQKLATPPDLRSVTLDVWNGECVQSLPLRWHGKRLWKDLDLDHFDAEESAGTVTRADRLGRVVARQTTKATVRIAAVFEQKEWNGRLQVPREQLDRLADIVYGKVNGKRIDPDYSKLEWMDQDPRAHSLWNRLSWFLTTSAKLQPQGPWLDYVESGLPEGGDYKKGSSGYYLNYDVNQWRKGRAQLKLARLPGLRVLLLDLGHRYAAACAVWETLTQEQMIQRAKLRVEPCQAAMSSISTCNVGRTRCRNPAGTEGRP